jgi:glutamine amidotransferase
VIGVVDYGMGNRRSVEKALEHVGAAPVLTGDADRLAAADGLVLPGVGAFPEAMRRLRAAALDETVRARVAAGVPLLGLCLGMHLLFDRSDEHEGGDGLGLVPGHVRRLRAPGLKLPHIGWNEVRWTRRDPLVDGLPDPSTFYHVHSYVAEPADPADALGVSDYGEPFVSVVGRGRIFGAQFHPEKSSSHGLALLERFARLCAPAAVAG